MDTKSIFDEAGDFPPIGTDEPPSPQVAVPGADVKREYDDVDIYKKWYKTGSKSGFLSLRPWFEAGKVSIDIGETGSGELKGNTLVWVNALEFATYLQAVYDGNAKRLYPSGRDTPTDEGFVYYGGGKVDGKPVSRILKIHYWKTGDDTFDPSAFVWKTGHFAARQTQSGAYIPDTSNRLSVNMIKIRRVEMAEISYRVNLALGHFVTTDDNPFEALNGNRR